MRGGPDFGRQMTPLATQLLKANESRPPGSGRSRFPRFRALTLNINERGYCLELEKEERRFEKLFLGALCLGRL